MGGDGRGRGTPIPLVRKKLTAHPPAVEIFSLFINHQMLFVSRSSLTANYYSATTLRYPPIVTHHPSFDNCR